MVKNPPANVGDVRNAGSIPRRRAQHPTAVFLPGESQGGIPRRSLVGYIVRRIEKNWTRTEVTKQATFIFQLHI